jgi:hypothetical protein
MTRTDADVHSTGMFSRLLLPDLAGARTIWSAMSGFRRLPFFFLLLTCASLAEGMDRVPIPRDPLAGQVGSTVPTFQMRTVSGPQMNRSVCHVCRNGERPVVMVVLRDLRPSQRVLLRNLDRIVEKERTRGLRSFAVFLSELPPRDISRVQTFTFNGRVDMPVGLAPDAIGTDQLGVTDQNRVSVILYSNQTVFKRYDFGEEGPTHDEIREILAGTEELLADFEQ